MSTAIAEQVRQIAADVFNLPAEQLRLTTTRDDVPQWDSLQHVNLVIALEQTFDIQFSPEDIDQMLSLDLIVLIVGDLTAARGDPRA